MDNTFKKPSSYKNTRSSQVKPIVKEKSIIDELLENFINALKLYL